MVRLIAYTFLCRLVITIQQTATCVSKGRHCHRAEMYGDGDKDGRLLEPTPRYLAPWMLSPLTQHSGSKKVGGRITLDL